jgi:PKD repeat protein
VSHAYIATGTYMVSLTVANGCGVTHTDQTTVTIFDCHSTQVFVVGGSKQINLQSGKPTWCVQVEAVDYDVADVDLSSIVLRSAGTGSVGEIHALSDKTSVGGDRNGNGLPEITACFRKEDLRQLFSNVTGTQQLQVTLTGNLSTGGSICAATLTITVKGGGGAIAASISPNPLNPSAVLTFTTHERGPVLVQLFDVRGRLLRTLRDEADAAAGYHDVRIDGTTENGARLSSGIYYVRIRAGVEEERKAITILK